jgi:uncharacterized protein (TIGR02466 family)
LYNHIFPITYIQVNIADLIDVSEIDGMIEEYNKEYFSSQDLIANKAGNWMTPDKLVLTKKYKNSKLTQVIEQHLNQYAKDIFGVYDNTLAITQSWVNFNPPGTGHHMHNHYNTVLSGTFYLSIPEGVTGDVVLEDNRQKGTIQHRGEINFFNTPQIFITPKQYDLVIFPSWLHHWVTPNEGEKIRKSLAFNSFYTSPLSLDPDEVSCTGLDVTLNRP